MNGECVMSDFNNFVNVVKKQFDMMSEHTLYMTDVDPDNLYEKYLDSFPEGTDNIFRERTEHNCSTCRQFIKRVGGVVVIINDRMVTVWDVLVEGFHQEVADSLSDYVKSHNIKSELFSKENHAGTEKTPELLEDGSVIVWKHFHAVLPAKNVSTNSASEIAKTVDNKDLLERSLEFSVDSIETVKDLILQNSLYRGEEHLPVVNRLLRVKRDYDDTENKELFLWKMSSVLGASSRIKNTVIGTLIGDLSDGVDLEDAVRMFESKVAPQNYKRSSALVTQGMIKKAQEKVASLGLEDSLYRRFAVEEDVNITNVIYADRSVKNSPLQNSVFDVVEAKAKKLNFKKVEEVTIDKFIKDIMPETKMVELWLENKHENNLVSLIAPVCDDAKPLFKWGNNFSWSYNGEFADSITERVKTAGGDVNGYVRCSLAWFNYDDLDIHVIEPDGTEISYISKISRKTGGNLDVDMNAGTGKTRNAVENIVYKNKGRMIEGVYTVFIENFNKRESIDVGFVVEFEYGGVIKTFNYDKPVKKHVTVLKFKFSHENGVEIIESIDSTDTPKELWDLNTNNFHTVKLLMNSPNHWDGEKTGNKHWFFVLEGCNNPNSARGFYNEFLNSELTEHRKVLEILSSKLKAEYSKRQLSGVGFSSTKRDHMFCKVHGAFTRILKVIF